jgi:hypothetical protein
LSSFSEAIHKAVLGIDYEREAVKGDGYLDIFDVLRFALLALHRINGSRSARNVDLSRTEFLESAPRAGEVDGELDGGVRLTERRSRTVDRDPS